MMTREDIFLALLPENGFAGKAEPVYKRLMHQAEALFNVYHAEQRKFEMEIRSADVEAQATRFKG
jgi:hypothetical protein